MNKETLSSFNFSFTKMIHLTQAFLFAMIIFTAPETLKGDVVIYNLDTSFSGTPPTGPAPWVTASFSDMGTNTVQLQLSTVGLTSQEFVDSWFFNFQPTANVNNLAFTRITPTPPGNPTINTGQNAFAADGGGYYDIVFSFPQPNDGSRFVGGESVTYNITSSDALTASMFNFLSSPHGENGTWYSAAHILNTGSDGLSSDWIGASDPVVHTPEPATYLTLGSLMTLFALTSVIRTRRRRA